MGDYVEKYTCGTCKYYEYKGQYEKGYCSYYKTYYYHDDHCNHWEEADGNTSGSSGCYLTTACCEFMGLSDDCVELSTMRRFRDDYLLKTEVGYELVKMYYKLAPGIVARLNTHVKKEIVYQDIYQRILTIVELVDKKQMDQAITEYINLLLFTQRSVAIA